MINLWAFLPFNLIFFPFDMSFQSTHARQCNDILLMVLLCFLFISRPRIFMYLLRFQQWKNLYVRVLITRGIMQWEQWTIEQIQLSEYHLSSYAMLKILKSIKIPFKFVINLEEENFFFLNLLTRDGKYSYMINYSYFLSTIVEISTIFFLIFNLGFSLLKIFLKNIRAHVMSNVYLNFPA